MLYLWALIIDGVLHIHKAGLTNDIGWLFGGNNISLLQETEREMKRQIHILRNNFL